MRTLLLTITLLLVPLCGQAATLTLLIWEGYLSENLVERWEQQTGHTLKQLYFDSDEQRDRMMADLSNLGVDLVLIDQVAAHFVSAKDLFSQVTPAQAPALHNMDPAFADSCASYSIPYAWGTLGLVYRKSHFSSAPDSWQTLLSPPAELQGHIGMLHDYVDTFAPALISAGLPVSSPQKDDLKKAFRLLARQVPAVLTYDYAISFVSGSQGRDLYMAQGYSGDQAVMNEIEGGEDWAYAVPKEGTILWTDCLGVIRNSAEEELARDFINFLYQPENAAQNMLDLELAAPNPAAISLLPEDFRNNTRIFPPAATMAASFRYQPLTPANIQLRRRILGSLMKAYEAQ